MLPGVVGVSVLPGFVGVEGCNERVGCYQI